MSKIPFIWLLPSSDSKVWFWFRRFLFVLGGGLLGFIVTWVFAFYFYHVPYTTSGANEVVKGVIPIGVFVGCLGGALVAYHMIRRKT